MALVAWKSRMEMKSRSFAGRSVYISLRTLALGWYCWCRFNNWFVTLSPCAYRADEQSIVGTVRSSACWSLGGKGLDRARQGAATSWNQRRGSGSREHCVLVHLYRCAETWLFQLWQKRKFWNCVHTHLGQTLGDQGYFSRLVHTTS